MLILPCLLFLYFFIAFRVINCFVHVVMYSYYFLSACNTRNAVPTFLKPLVVKLLQVKKYITTMQLIQFTIVFCRNVYGAYIADPATLKYPRINYLIEGWYMVSMLVLFSNFYFANYSNKSKDE